MLIWIKQTLISFNLQRDGTGNGLSNIKETFTESLRLQMSALHQRMSNFQSSRLVSQVHDAWAKCKEKVPCQILIKIVKQQATQNSSLDDLKIYSSKACRKTSQIWIYVASYNYVATYLQPTPTTCKHSSSKYSDFQQQMSLQIIGFCFDWWIHFLLTLMSILPSVLQSKWCQDL